LKERREKQKDKQFKADCANYAKIMKDRKEFQEIASPGPEKDFYEREAKWKVKKKRKKRYRKLWRNTFLLVDYRGTLEVSYEMVLKRRKIRAVEEVYLFNNFGFRYVRKEVELLIKGFNKLCYSEPRERRSESMDCECEAQTINHQSNVVMTRPAAETEVCIKILTIGKDDMTKAPQFQLMEIFV
jgi:hypothetical protein